MNTAKAKQLQPTLHACLRYAQRVLGHESMELHDLRANPQMLERCRNGLRRIADEAEQVGIGRPGIHEGSVLFLRRTRALVVKRRRILTVLVSPRPEGFRKELLRRFDLSPSAIVRGVAC